MTETMTELPPGAVLAKTWEECAAHLEQHGDMGGEVWINDPQGRWHRGEDTAGDLRGLSSTPGKGGWFPRALLPPKWRPCADPVELAAAVAAGVEVQCVAVDGRTWETGCEDSESFRRCMANDCRYRLPVSWSPEPPAPVTGDDLPERRVWTCKIGGRVGRLSGGADAPMRRAVADAFTAETGCPVEFCFSGWGDDLDESELAVVEDRAPDPEAIRAALVKRLTALPPPEPPAPVTGDDLPPDGCEAVWLPTDVVDEWVGLPTTDYPPSLAQARATIYACREAQARRGSTPTPSPVPPWPGDVLRDAANRLRWVANSGYIEDPGIKRIIRSWADELDATPAPPWPGAVLSGLCDEDGVPTWLAQAGQVRGEQVRLRHLDDEWATWATLDGDQWVEVRAPRAVPEPETERVGVWDALMNERTAVGYDGTPMKLRRGQTILYTRVDGGGGRLMYDDASHPEDKRPLVDPDGTVEVLVEAGQ